MPMWASGGMGCSWVGRGRWVGDWGGVCFAGGAAREQQQDSVQITSGIRGRDWDTRARHKVVQSCFPFKHE